LLFSSSYLCCYAQKDVDDDPEKVLQTFVKEFNQQDASFFKSRLSQDFRYIDGNGHFLNGTTSSKIVKVVKLETAVFQK